MRPASAAFPAPVCVRRPESGRGAGDTRSEPRVWYPRGSQELERRGFFEAQSKLLELSPQLRLSPHLPASPALRACRQYRLSNPLEGLIGSKTLLSAPRVAVSSRGNLRSVARRVNSRSHRMDIGIVAALALLLI